MRIFATLVPTLYLLPTDQFLTFNYAFFLLKILLWSQGLFAWGLIGSFNDLSIVYHVIPIFPTLPLCNFFRLGLWSCLFDLSFEWLVWPKVRMVLISWVMSMKWGCDQSRLVNTPRWCAPYTMGCMSIFMWVVIDWPLPYRAGFWYKDCADYANYALCAHHVQC